MKKKRIWILLVCAAAAAAIVLALTLPRGGYESIREENAGSFGRLLEALVSAYETPSDADAAAIEAILGDIRSEDRRDYQIALSIAEHWRRVYLDPDCRLCLHRDDESAGELADAVPKGGRRHAIVVLGYELKDGQMQPELAGRCEAAAAAARALPSAILVCSGGATGPNNPEGHTEAGLMKACLSERCGVDPGRIFIDEEAMTTAENAVNTFGILREHKIRTMTIVTSAYHQRWGQAVYNAVGALFRQRYGFGVRIVGNYCLDIEPSVELYRLDDRIAAMQIGQILGLPEDVMRTLPSLRMQPPAKAA